ncbi:MAG TPA: beta-ketoacyl synthase [Cellvibrionaceae bacterium]
MTNLPVIVGFGGYNAAGRSSGHRAYHRMIFESLSASVQQETILSLAALMKLAVWDGDSWTYEGQRQNPAACAELCRDAVLKGTLIRRIEENFFDPDAAVANKSIRWEVSEGADIFILATKNIPEPLPAYWIVEEIDDKTSRVRLSQPLDIFLPCVAPMAVQSAGQLPSGFNPGDHYRSLNHPRGLQLAIMGASDAIHSIGIDWETIVNAVQPDEIAVYSSSVMSQMDTTGFGGMMQARTLGARPTSKQLALGLNTMPADFVNAYVLGSVGSTGGVTGACATFLYNLRIAADEIKAGKRRVAVVGSSEAPIIPEVIEGYSAMGALATDANLAKLDGSDNADHRRSCRPFGDNCGFTIAEASQYVVLMNDALAIELGADILGAVPGVFVHADGYKKSISAPGPGNYITLAKAVGLAVQLLGDETVRQSSFVQAHGSSTPQNRVTESRIFDRVAEHFDIKRWPLAAVKAYVGHSLGPASGDQLACTLGVFAEGVLPGIKTITSVAADVTQERLSISATDQQLSKPQAAFLNSKGFGGNNASALVIAPESTFGLLAKRYSQATLASYEEKRSQTQQRAQDYFAAADKGDLQAIYRFGEELLHEEDLVFSAEGIRIKGFEQAVPLTSAEGFEDWIG